MFMLDSIAGGITAVNGSMELMRAISGASGVMEKAELKLKAAEVMGALAEVKIALIQSQEDAREWKLQIAELREALETKGNVAKRYDAMYLTNEAGDASGDPFCLQCWQATSRLRHLVKGDRSDAFNHCTSCKSKYARSRSSFSVGSQDPE